MGKAIIHRRDCPMPVSLTGSGAWVWPRRKAPNLKHCCRRKGHSRLPYTSNPSLEEQHQGRQFPPVSCPMPVFPEISRRVLSVV
jgi:hypothetical protein